MTPNQLRRRNEAIRRAKEKGRALRTYQGGNCPFGYRRECHALVEDAKQQDVIAALGRIVERNLSMSYRKIAEQIELSLGVRISHMTVKRILSKYRKNKD